MPSCLIACTFSACLAAFRFNLLDDYRIYWYFSRWYITYECTLWNNSLSCPFHPLVDGIDRAHELIVYRVGDGYNRLYLGLIHYFHIHLSVEYFKEFIILLVCGFIGERLTCRIVAIIRFKRLRFLSVISAIFVFILGYGAWLFAFAQNTPRTMRATVTP